MGIRTQTIDSASGGTNVFQILVDGTLRVGSASESFVSDAVGEFENAGANIEHNGTAWQNAITYGPDLTTDLAVGALSISSERGGVDRMKAIDNNFGTAWGSAVAVAPNAQWFKVDFGYLTPSIKKTIVQANICTMDSVRIMLVQGSNDDTNWDNLYSGSLAGLNSPNYNAVNFVNITAYRYYKITLNQTAEDQCNIYEVELKEAGSVPTTDNTVDTLELISSGTKNGNPATLLLKDEAGTAITTSGKVNVAYNTGTGWSTLEDLLLFQARPLTDLDSITSLKIRIQPVGSQQVSYVGISVVASTVDIKPDASVLITVASGVTFNVTPAGTVTSSGTMQGDSFLGRQVSIDDTDSPYSVDSNYNTVLIDADTNNVEVILPAATGLEGRRYTLKLTTQPGSGKTVVLTPGTGSTIDGAANYASLLVIYDSVTLESDGSNWFIVAESFNMTPLESDAATVNLLANSKRKIRINYTDTGAVAVNLPASAGCVDGREFEIVDSVGGAGTFNITITPNGADTVANAASLPLTSTGESIVLKLNKALGNWEAF